MNSSLLLLVFFFLAVFAASPIECADADIGGIFSGISGLLGSIGGLAGAAGGKKKVCLSLCSKKTYHRVKASIPRYAFCQLDFVGDSLSTYLHTKTSYFKVFGAAGLENATDGLSVEVINKHTVTAAWNTELGCLQTYWIDEKEGFQHISIYLAKLFENAAHLHTIRRASLWMTDWVQSKLGSSYTAHVPYNEPLNAEDYLYILNKCTAKSLYLYARPTEAIYHWDSFIRRDILSISFGRWLYLEHLIRLECREIRISYSSLNAFNFDFVLKHWLGGGFQQLKFLEVRTTEMLDWRMIGHGLDAKKIFVDHARIFHGPHGELIHFSAGISDLRREDGRIASFGCVQNRFCMVVWPDMLGNLP